MTTTFEIVTIFPEMFSSVLSTSLLGKALDKGALKVAFTDPRDFARPSAGGRRSVDDTPYGGGAGMVMRPDPLVAAIEHVEAARGRAHKVLLSPSGPLLTQARVVGLAAQPRLLLVCGRYEGCDERVGAYVDEELSLGDYVLTGGELPAMVLLDAVARRLEGVLGNPASPLGESFEDGLLEFPQYTRPAEFRGATVPEVLLSGDHERVRRWRRRQSLLRTRARRPDLFARLTLSSEDRALLDEP
jgi:tRNA (guanine37-N1)-methyltransferase